MLLAGSSLWCELSPCVPGRKGCPARVSAPAILQRHQNILPLRRDWLALITCSADCSPISRRSNNNIASRSLHPVMSLCRSLTHLYVQIQPLPPTVRKTDIKKCFVRPPDLSRPSGEGNKIIRYGRLVVMAECLHTSTRPSPVSSSDQ